MADDKKISWVEKKWLIKLNALDGAKLVNMVVNGPFYFI